MRFVLLLIGIAIASGFVTFLLHQIKVRWVKNIPAILFMIVGLIMIIKARNGSGEGMQDLGWIVLAILSITAAVGSLLTIVMLYWIERNRN